MNRKPVVRFAPSPTEYLHKGENIQAKASGYQGEKSELFLLGLFSQMGAILDQELAQIIGELPLSPLLKSAIVKEEGDLGCYLTLVRNYERGLWENCQDIDGTCQSVKMTVEKYLEAIGWADAFSY